MIKCMPRRNRLCRCVWWVAVLVAAVSYLLAAEASLQPLPVELAPAGE